MSREEIQKLLGGYATDTLNEAERRALFDAALEDQELFDALAKEQALREVLQDPAARQELIAALAPPREPFAARVWRWLRQPAALAMAGSMAALLIIGGIVLRQAWQPKRPEILMADALVKQLPAPAPAESGAPARKMESPARESMLKRPAKSADLRTIPAPPLGQPVAQSAAQSAAQPAAQPLAHAAPANLPAALPSAPPALAESRPAAPPPASSGTLAGGALADKGEGRRDEAAQEKDTRVMGFSAQNGLAKSSMKRAKAVAPVAAKPAVEYTLMLKAADGAYSAVPSGTVFHAGDAVRLQVAPNDAGYIYLYRRAATTGWSLVASQRAGKSERYMLPSTGDLQSDTPARLELLLVISHTEQNAFAPSQASQAAEADTLQSEVQASSRITLEFR